MQHFLNDDSGEITNYVWLAVPILRISQAFFLLEWAVIFLFTTFWHLWDNR